MPATRQHFEHELHQLRRQLAHMGADAQQMVQDALTALREHNPPLARLVIHNDDAVDEQERQAEALCLRLLGLQQPVAADLRLVGMSLKMLTDLERIGDHGVNLARLALGLDGPLLAPADADLWGLSERVCHMLDEAVGALTDWDLSRVRRVLGDEEALEALYEQVVQALTEMLPQAAQQAAYLLFAAHYLKRIGDHCRNLAERVLFIETGR